MQIITCPEVNPPISEAYRVFLAGGISNCSNWQQQAVEYFKTQPISDKFALFNPRRETFDVTNPADTEFQIRWEYEQIKRCQTVLFWFPHETLCPITLYELGVCAARGTHIIVGTDPEYKRRLDVVEQLKHIRPEITVYNDLDTTLFFASSNLIALQRTFYGV